MNRQINEVQMKHTNGLNDRNNEMAAAAAAAEKKTYMKTPFIMIENLIVDTLGK